MAWTDQCQIEAVRQVDHHIEKGQTVRKALKLVSEESDIPVSTLDRWKYPRKPVVKNDDKHKDDSNESSPENEPTDVPTTTPAEKPVQDHGYQETLKAMEKAVRAAKRGKYKTIPREDILGDLDALRNMVVLTPRTTKRQTELQQFFFQVDEDITRRAAFHVENIKIGDQMRVGDKLTTRGKILKLKGGKVLDVRVVVEKR